MNWRRWHAWAAVLWVVAIVVQVFLAGAAIGNLGGSGDFSTHQNVGYSMGVVQLVALVLAFPARMSGRDKAISGGLLLLYIVQTVLPPLRSTIPFFAELHPLNAMILFTLSVWYARRAWRVSSLPVPSGSASLPETAEAAAKAG